MLGAEATGEERGGGAGGSCQPEPVKWPSQSESVTSTCAR